jgi:serine/threonine protein kinase
MLLDFGLAKSQQDETLTATNAVMGTPKYMAPEQREWRRTSLCRFRISRSSSFDSILATARHVQDGIRVVRMLLQFRMPAVHPG